MNIKKTYICLEPGETHPVLCILLKTSELIGRLNPKEKITYTIHTLEALPSEINNFDILELIKTRMKAYVIGDIRFILGYTYIAESTARFYEGTSLKPAKITVTGDQESYKDKFMLYVPYSELLARMDELKEQDAITFAADVSESLAREDDDCDLSLGMAVWYASQDLEQVKKNVPGIR